MIERWAELEKAATDGPWHNFNEGTTLDINDGGGDHSRHSVVHWSGFDASGKPMREKIANAELIVFLRNRSAQLRKVVEAMQRIAKYPEVRGDEMSAEIMRKLARDVLDGLEGR